MTLRSRSKLRRAAGLVMLLFGLSGIAAILHDATDFPTEDPIVTVDAALVTRLRAHPGLHLALAPDYRLAVSLDLLDDPENRRIYGTVPDLRERRADRSIHIQAKNGRFAIHADARNPRAGLWPLLLHGTLDVPVIPLGLCAAIGLLLLMWPARLLRHGRFAPCSS